MLRRDVEARGHHLTVGSAGQKWLLRELTDSGAHDTALRLALQTTQPSWGYWVRLAVWLYTGCKWLNPNPLFTEGCARARARLGAARWGAVSLRPSSLGTTGWLCR